MRRVKALQHFEFHHFLLIHFPTSASFKFQCTLLTFHLSPFTLPPFPLPFTFTLDGLLGPHLCFAPLTSKEGVADDAPDQNPD